MKSPSMGRERVGDGSWFSPGVPRAAGLVGMVIISSPSLTRAPSCVRENDLRLQNVMTGVLETIEKRAEFLPVGGCKAGGSGVWKETEGRYGRAGPWGSVGGRRKFRFSKSGASMVTLGFEPGGTERS